MNESTIMRRTIVPPHQGEYVAAIAAKGFITEALITQQVQYDAGFRACAADEPFAEYRPAAWQEGWIVAYQLGAIGPLAALRMDAED